MQNLTGQTLAITDKIRYSKGLSGPAWKAAHVGGHGYINKGSVSLLSVALLCGWKPLCYYRLITVLCCLMALKKNTGQSSGYNGSVRYFHQQ